MERIVYAENNVRFRNYICFNSWNKLFSYITFRGLLIDRFAASSSSDQFHRCDERTSVRRDDNALVRLLPFPHLHLTLSLLSLFLFLSCPFPFSIPYSKMADAYTPSACERAREWRPWIAKKDKRNNIVSLMAGQFERVRVPSLFLHLSPSFILPPISSFFSSFCSVILSLFFSSYLFLLSHTLFFSFSNNILFFFILSLFPSHYILTMSCHIVPNTLTCVLLFYINFAIFHKFYQRKIKLVNFKEEQLEN